MSHAIHFERTTEPTRMAVLQSRWLSMLRADAADGSDDLCTIVAATEDPAVINWEPIKPIILSYLRHLFGPIQKLKCPTDQYTDYTPSVTPPVIL